MTNDELRLKIAELKGCHGFYKYLPCGYPGNGILHAQITVGDNSADCVVPDWPTDPSAALELLEEMRGITKISRVAFRGFGQPESSIDYHYEIDHHGIHGPEDHPVYAKYDTFCRAVSLIYVTWKEATK